MTGLFYTGLIQIKIELHLLTITFIGLIICIFVYYYCGIIRRGIKSLWDFVFRSKVTLKAEYIEQKPYSASVFTEKYSKNFSACREQRYLIVVKFKDELLTIVSSSPVELEKNKIYNFTMGKYSGVLLDIGE